LRQASSLRLFHHAQDELEAVRRALAGLESGGVLRVETAGAVRRRCELIGALDLVAVHEGQAAREALVRRLARAPGVTEIAGREGNVTLCFASGTVVDVLLTTPERFGLDWIRATGSPDHVAALEIRARAMGVSLSTAFPDEPSLYRALGLAWGPDGLDRFDFVIGSIHSRFGMSEAEMTRRVLTAMDDPHLAILGHPTGRLLLQREPYAIDLEQVLAKAAGRGIAVEVNADPHRLDLDWRVVRRARDLGVTFSI